MFRKEVWGAAPCGPPCPKCRPQGGRPTGLPGDGTICVPSTVGQWAPQHLLHSSQRQSCLPLSGFMRDGAVSGYPVSQQVDLPSTSLWAAHTQLLYSSCPLGAHLSFSLLAHPLLRNLLNALTGEPPLPTSPASLHRLPHIHIPMQADSKLWSRSPQAVGSKPYGSRGWRKVWTLTRWRVSAFCVCLCRLFWAAMRFFSLLWTFLTSSDESWEAEDDEN